MDQIVVTVVGILSIMFTYWFFLKKTEKAILVTDSINITVDGGYSPEVITIAKSKATTLIFKRTDPTTCLEDVVLGDFKIQRHLPLNQKVAITLTPTEEGEFVYSCGMGMYHGKIIVK